MPTLPLSRITKWSMPAVSWVRKVNPVPEPEERMCNFPAGETVPIPTLPPKVAKSVVCSLVKVPETVRIGAVALTKLPVVAVTVVALTVPPVTLPVKLPVKVAKLPVVAMALVALREPAVTRLLVKLPVRVAKLPVAAIALVALREPAVTRLLVKSPVKVAKLPAPVVIKLVEYNEVKLPPAAVAEPIAAGAAQVEPCNFEALISPPPI